ncbi:MAG: mercuric transport protein MerTP, partial [Balneolales bacterium]
MRSTDNSKWLGAGIATAFLAALCCITPVFAVLAGISGIASMFSWLEPFRPWMISLSGLFIGLAWFQHLKPRKQVDCKCEDDPSFFKSKGFLGMITVAVSLLITFPYYSDIFIRSNNSPQVVIGYETQVERVTFDIEGMTCTGCETSVKHAVQRVDGVLKTEVSYQNRKATIAFDKTQTTRQ